MKYRAAHQLLRDHEKLVEKIAETQKERASVEERAHAEQVKLEQTIGEMRHLTEKQAEANSTIDRLNRELTEAHSKRRALQDEETKLVERTRTHAIERDRIRAVDVAAADRRGADLQAKLEKIEKDLPAAKARLERVEQRKREAAAAEAVGEKIVKVVHVGMDGKPWNLVQKNQPPFKLIQKKPNRPS